MREFVKTAWRCWTRIPDSPTEDTCVRFHFPIDLLQALRHLPLKLHIPLYFLFLHSFLNFHLGKHSKVQQERDTVPNFHFSCHLLPNITSAILRQCRWRRTQSRLIISTSGAGTIKVCKPSHPLQHLQRLDASVLVCKRLVTVPFLDRLPRARIGGIWRGGSAAEGAWSLWLFFYN